jgi:DNA-binding SARP family transcriptional activator
MESNDLVGGKRTRVGDQRDLRLYLLRSFRLTYRAAPFSLPSSAQRLVAFLALLNQPVSRTQVAAALWREYPEERAGANLRSALWRLRRPGLTVVEADGDRLSLALGVAVDLHEAVARAWQLVSGETDPDDLEDEHWFLGDLLPGWYEEWLLLEQERFQQLRLHALETLAERLAQAGRFARAIDAAMAAVHADPLRETARIALIKVHLAEGNLSQAVQHYHRYHALLGEELGLEPLTQLTELLQNANRDRVDYSRTIRNPLPIHQGSR